MWILFLGLFILNAFFHCTVIFLGRERLRRISKVTLMPLLLGFYIAGAERLLLTVVLGGLLGWAGDILLIRIDKPKNLRLGLAGFLLGHICYILSLSAFTGSYNGAALAVSAGVIVLLSFGIFTLIRPPKEMVIPVIIYELVIGGMSVCALQLLLYRRNLPALIIFAGSLCFLLSDSILGWSTFNKAKKQGNLSVMLSYILAQTGIIIGLAWC
ncbi:MAG: lysoplasmalogenase [Spirochaetaceae bacterium]|jgi:uncharacterized membrane protein YhhN|nr:lysoplasmalogenase [Spirochaetaceae bacterium]